MNDLRYFHRIDAESSRRMAQGQTLYGVFDAGALQENWTKNGIEELADATNYAEMQRQEFVIFATKDKTDFYDDLIKEIEAIKAECRALGARWCKLESLIVATGIKGEAV